MQSVFLSVLQHKYRNSNCYYRLLLLFLSDIRLNPGPSYNLHQLDPLRKKCSYSKSFSSAFSRIFPAVSPRIQSECGKMLSLSNHDKWNFFQHKGLYFLHINISSLLSKIDEHRYMVYRYGT